jgi:hypothetical protein
MKRFFVPCVTLGAAATCSLFLFACGSTSLLSDSPAQDAGPSVTTDASSTDATDAAPDAITDAGVDAIDAPPPRDPAALLRPLDVVPGSPHWPTSVVTAKDGVYVVSPLRADAGLGDLPTQIARLGADGGWESVFAENEYIWDVAVDESGVYYSDDRGIYRLAADGGAPTRLTSDPQRPQAMILDHGDLLYATDDDVASVYRVPTDGTPPRNLGAGFYEPDSLGRATDGVYVTEGGRLKLLTGDGGAPKLLTDSVHDVVAYQGIAYVENLAQSGVLRVGPDGVIPFAAATQLVGHTVDATGVYFMDKSGLWRATLDQQEIVRIAAAFPPNGYLYRMATDERRVYVAAEWLYAADKADP